MSVLINRNSGLAEDVVQTPETLQTHRVPLTTPEGHSVSVNADRALELLHQGYRQPNQNELVRLMEHAKYNSTSEQIKTGLEGAAEGILGPVATGAEVALGVNPSDISKREEYNPGVHSVAKGATLAGSMFTGVGEGELLLNAGNLAERAILSAGGKGVLAKIGAGAARGVVENAIYSAGDEISKLIKQDPQQSIETALADVGLSAAFGAGVGGAFGAGGAAWDHLMEGKASSYTKGVKDKLNEYIKPLKEATDEPRGPIKNFPDKADLSKHIADIGEPVEDIKPARTSTIDHENANNPDYTFDPFKKKYIERAEPVADDKATSEGAEFSESLVKKYLHKYLKEDAGGLIGGKIGLLVGQPLPGYLMGKHMLQPLLDSVMPALIDSISNNPVSGAGFKSALNFGKAVISGESRLNDAAKAVFQGGKIESIKDSSEMLNKHIAGAMESPEHLMESGKDVGHYLPEHAQALGQHIGQAVNYLNSLKPSTSALGPMDSQRIPSAIEIAKYKNALNIAEDPIAVLSKIKRGNLTLDDIKHLHALYPKLTQSIQNKLMEQMLTHTSKGGKVPYKTKLMLSMFLGGSMDSSMEPSYIMANQPQPNQGGDQQGRQPHKVEKLDKFATSTQTGMQSSEARKQKV